MEPDGLQEAVEEVFNFMITEAAASESYCKSTPCKDMGFTQKLAVNHKDSKIVTVKMKAKILKKEQVKSQKVLVEDYIRMKTHLILYL